ncbi:sensor histidine kinase [Altererythrobacter sp. Z27]|uniref:sensor histidine kinase n=1 Tax=Altererythrobacter sp. Z27 TaxID=3461147 RepID=UPI0040446FD2
MALTARWLAYVSLSIIAIAGAALVALYIVEDRFIDQRLRSAAAQVDRQGEEQPGPISAYDELSLPLDIGAQIADAQNGQIFEMRRANGRYVHVLPIADPGTGTKFLVYDATDELVVNDLLGNLVWALALFLLLIVGGAWISLRRFFDGIASDAERLGDAMLNARDADSLRATAGAERFAEMAQFARLHADLWDTHLKTVQAEREMLGYLSHELRTPLQSARNALALLEEDEASRHVHGLLNRAIARLTRASNTALWLGSDRIVQSDSAVSVDAVLGQLAAEFEPLAQRAGQEITVASEGEWVVNMPEDILETLLASLLFNAVQHGGPGAVAIALRPNHVRISNPLRENDARPGFGMGIDIAGRLAARIGWNFETSIEGGAFHASLTA